MIGKEIFARKLVFPIFFDTFNFKIIIYIIKEFVQPKKTPSNREFLIWKERGRGERERGGRAGQQAGIFKVRLGLVEIERLRGKTERQRET